MSAPKRYGGVRILQELEADYRDQLAAAGLAPAARSPKAADGRRVARRVSVLATGLLLVGATAIAEISREDGHPRVNTSPAQLSTGTSGTDRWRLTSYRNDGDVCHALVVGGVMTSACGPALTPDGIRATSVAGVTRRFVVGLAGSRVARVRVTIAGQPRTAATTSALEAGVADLPAGLRWFVVPVALTQRTADAPAWLKARRADGRLTGRSVLDCSLGQGSAPCVALTGRRAAG